MAEEKFSCEYSIPKLENLHGYLENWISKMCIST